jgi:hypothetical protein
MIQASLALASPCDDQEMITNEEHPFHVRLAYVLSIFLPLGSYLNNTLTDHFPYVLGGFPARCRRYEVGI